MAYLEPGVVTHTFNPSTWEAGFCHFKLYRTSSGTAKVITQRNRASENEKIKTKKASLEMGGWRLVIKINVNNTYFLLINTFFSLVYVYQ